MPRSRPLSDPAPLEWRRSPLHDVLAMRGARFGACGGWARALWFANGGSDDATDASREERRAVTDAVAIWDCSPEGRVRVEGAGTAVLLNACPGLAFPEAVGEVASVTSRPDGASRIDRVCEDVCVLVAPAGCEAVLIRSLERARADEDTVIRDVTSGEAVLAVAGPRAAALIDRASNVDPDADGFVQGSSRQIEAGFALARAVRVRWAGVDRFDLHVPSEFGPHVYETLVEYGETLGLRDAGWLAVAALGPDADG